MRIIFFILFMLILVPYAHADIRKIVITAEVHTLVAGAQFLRGHISDSLETGEVEFYPYSTVDPTYSIILPMKQVVKKRLTGCEWYKLDTSEVDAADDDTHFKFTAPQFLAGKDVDIKWENPWAFTSREAYIEFVPANPPAATRKVRHYFFSPPEVFWRSYVFPDGTVWVAYDDTYSGHKSAILPAFSEGFATNVAPINAQASTPDSVPAPPSWNATDSPTENSYPFWAYAPMRKSQNMSTGLGTSNGTITDSYLMSCDDNWATKGYSDLPSWGDFYASRQFPRGIEAVPGKGYQLKILSRQKGYPDYGIMDFIFKAPRPKGIVKWTKVKIINAIKTSPGYFDGEAVYKTSNLYIGPLNDSACLFPNSGYTTPDNEYLFFDCVDKNSVTGIGLTTRYYCEVPDSNTKATGNNPLYLNIRSKSDFFKFADSVYAEVYDTDSSYDNDFWIKTNIGYVLDSSTKPAVRFWVAAYNDAQDAANALDSIETSFDVATLSAKNYYPSDMIGKNAWSADISGNNIFGKYLILRIAIYTNSDTVASDGKASNPKYNAYDTEDRVADDGTVGLPNSGDLSRNIHLNGNHTYSQLDYGCRNDGTMTPRVKGLELSYVEYNPVIRMKNIDPSEANDGSDYNNWQPKIFGMDTGEVWDFTKDKWEKGSSTSEVYVSHE